MQGITLILPSSIVGLFCNKKSSYQHTTRISPKKGTLVLTHHYHQWDDFKMSKSLRSRHHPPIISLRICRGITPSHILYYLEYFNLNPTTNKFAPALRIEKTGVTIKVNVWKLVPSLLDGSQLQDTFSDLYQRHTRNSNIIQDKIACRW
jgi:hypothetical protein